MSGSKAVGKAVGKELKDAVSIEHYNSSDNPDDSFAPEGRVSRPLPSRSAAWQETAMIALEDTACILLAAGQSRRFGAANKLRAELHGKPLASHAADTLGAMPFGEHIAVVSSETSDLFDLPFKTVLNTAQEQGMSHSIALGIEAINEGEVKAVLIALADMPFVPTGHYKALLEAVEETGEPQIAATQNSGRAQVPAVFSLRKAHTLLTLEGDQGARDLLQSAKTVACDSRLLTDFDRAEDFI
ncbi:nucleotidyltransferase family protein [Altererythrobacter lutimaris]|uniref:Nucleotidyltransferase family protein n=1 Tax=Altererythrobacter lutimaris TaxID=2743979 RepID=A0A850HBT7_9SPHN|nr:nucleotidyltransferase family protein [Altererythrobacter lutimaris]NVE95010.1 nucleotidyltransferase family protein [Altererythrobacter lutimaris]